MRIIHRWILYALNAVCITLVALFGLTTQHALAQTQAACSKPLTANALQSLLSGKVSEQRISILIDQCGVIGSYTKTLEKELRAAGASNGLLSKIRSRVREEIPSTQEPSVRTRADWFQPTLPPRRSDQFILSNVARFKVPHYSPDAVVSSDGNIIALPVYHNVWVADLRNPGRLTRLVSAGDINGTGAFSGDGELFAFSNDKNFQVFRWRTSRLDHEKVIERHSAFGGSMAFSGRDLAIGYAAIGYAAAQRAKDKCQVDVWSLASDTVRHVLPPVDSNSYPPCTHLLSVSPDGTVLAVAADREIGLRKSNNGDLIATLRVPDHSIRDDLGDFSEDGAYLAVGGYDEVAIYDVKGAKLIKTLTGARKFCFTANAKYLAVAMPNTVKIIEWQSGTPISSFELDPKYTIETLVQTKAGPALVVSFWTDTGFTTVREVWRLGDARR